MNGNFTRLPNDFLDVLMSSAINHSEAKIIIFIARKTWGFHKETDQISLSQFQNRLKLSRPLVIRTLRRLVKSGLLVKEKGYKRVSNSWSIDLKDYKDKLVTLGQLVKFGTIQLVTLGLHTKESITKEKKKSISAEEEDRLWENLNKASDVFHAKKETKND